MRSSPVFLSLTVFLQMRFMLLFSRQGKLRLQKWYTATAERDKKKMVRELMQVVLARKPKMCSFLEWRDLKIVYKRQKTTHAFADFVRQRCQLQMCHFFSQTHKKLSEIKAKVKKKNVSLVHTKHLFSHLACYSFSVSVW